MQAARVGVAGSCMGASAAPVPCRWPTGRGASRLPHNRPRVDDHVPVCVADPAAHARDRRVGCMAAPRVAKGDVPREHFDKLSDRRNRAQLTQASTSGSQGDQPGGVGGGQDRTVGGTHARTEAPSGPSVPAMRNAVSTSSRAPSPGKRTDASRVPRAFAVRASRARMRVSGPCTRRSSSPSTSRAHWRS